MGGHHKKQLRAEKAKVKLKGAKLPKGLNVTKTEFKVRKIEIRNQLNDSIIDGQRQIKLKEVLTRLKHTNSNIRQEALKNVREYILANPANFSANLAQIVPSVSALCLDIERDTRRECCNTMKHLLLNLTQDAVAPFFHIISSYLRCAMTHIQPTIQEDSLLLLGVLLQFVPRLVATHSNKIFQNFIEMISRVRADGSSNRTLTLNLGQKQTSTKWLSKVLHYLQLMLRSMVEAGKDSVDNIDASNNKLSRCQLYTFNYKTPQYYPIKKILQSADISELFIRYTRSDAEKPELTGISHEQKLLQKYIEHLLPLILEAWMEIRPQEPNNSAVNTTAILSADTAATLSTLLEIVEHLWELVDLHEREFKNRDLSEWVQKEYADSFSNTFLRSGAFPYQQFENAQQQETGKKMKKPISVVGSQYCWAQNIRLTHLLCRFHASKSYKMQSKSMLEYLQFILENKKLKSTEEQNILVTALYSYLLSEAKLLLQWHPNEIRGLLRSAISAFLERFFTKENGTSARVLILLCDIIQSSNLMEDYGAAEFMEFLSYLPKLLLDPSIVQTALISMSHLARQSNPILLKALEEISIEIIQNLAKIQITGAVNAFEGKKLIMNLFCWVNKEHLNMQQLVQKIEEHIMDKRIVGYFKYVLTIK